MSSRLTVIFCCCAAVAGAATATPFKPSDAPNMNGAYVLSSTPGATGTAEKFPTNYRDYPGGVEYFDVYSPNITTLYSQVFWKGLDPVPLPADIVERYKGKGMAVVGFEVDQVRRGAGPNGTDVSVPIQVSYNHHFESNMVGAQASLRKIHFTGPEDPRLLAELERRGSYGGHGLPSHEELWVVEDAAPDSAIPNHQSFGGANGGEYRKSFHGYAPGFAQVIDSPTEFQITPMQIDTFNREHMNLTGPTRFVPGPAPRNSLAPTEGPDAIYSGLLECPVTTRIRKVIEGAYAFHADGAPACAGTTAIATASECFAAVAGAAAVAPANVTTKEVSDDEGYPPACSAFAGEPDSTGRTRIHAVFNKVTATAALPPCASPSAGVSMVAGEASSLVDVRVAMDLKNETVLITLTGPAGVWFGVGFNASAMKDAPWAVIVDGEGQVSERKLADQNPGVELKASVTVVASTTAGGRRTVHLRRPLQGAGPEYFTFSAALAGTVLPFINAVGSGPQLAYHKQKTPASLALLPVGEAACVCAEAPAPFGQAKGKLVYVPVEGQPGESGSGTIGFNNNCAPQPRTDMLAQHNPTCDVRTYVGGQIACHHMFSLLDADQAIPWVDQPLTMHLKFRFWVQPYNASYHTNVLRTTWGIASPVEYDVPKCGPKVPGCSRGADGSWIHTIRGTYAAGGRLAAAHFHCHAPTCLSMAMYRCPKGAKDCNETTGELLCREDPIYGGTGKVDNPNMDEPGYILQPPCLWGDSAYGLEAPPDTTGYMLHTVKTSNATYGHHGEMAWQQMYYY